MTPRLRLLLDVWPADLPLTVEFQHQSWRVDEVFDLLREHGAALCATDLDELDPPDLRRTGHHVYLRLRRTSYTDDELGAWADRLEAFLADGVDCYVFLRHDEDGTSALRALRLLARLDPDQGGGEREPARPRSVPPITSVGQWTPSETRAKPMTGCGWSRR